MAINIVQTISGFLTPDVIARFASAIGVNPTVAQTLANAVLPTILASLGGAASTPAGAQRLADQIGAQDPGVLDNLAATFSGSDHASLASSGASTLTSMLGGAGVSGVAGALSKLTGAQAGQAQSALGMLTPVALAAIGRQDPSNWSSGQALSGFMASQSDAIQKAMPPGLGGALAGLGLPALSNFASPVGAVRDAAASAAASVQGAAANVHGAARDAVAGAGRMAGDATRAAGDAARGAAHAAESGAPGWLWPAVAVVVLGALAWWYMGRSPAPEPAPKPAATAPKPPATAPTQQAAPAAPAIPAAPAAPVVDIAGTAAGVATATVASLQQTFAGITDAASAKAAEGKLKDAAAQVDKASAAIMALPESARKTVATQTKPAVSALQDQVTKILALPGVGEILKPIVDPMMAKLTVVASG